MALILLVLGAVLILLIKKTALKKPKYQAYIRLDLQNANYCLQKTVITACYHQRLPFFDSSVQARVNFWGILIFWR